MEWNARTPSLWDWDSALPCDAGEYKSPGAGGDGSWAAGASTSSSGSSLRFPDVAVVPSPVLEFEVDVNHNGSALIFQDAEYSSLATVEEETSTSPPLGLKLGKRTYFEDVTPADQSAAVVSKKPRKCDQGLQQQVYCQVEGCEVELSAAKEYYRKHRVCEVHTKCPRVIVSGEERRFCQQCSRFHELLEFDQEKRSCRKRLSDHNARRRKPQPDMISFCSSIFTVSTYDDEDDDTNQISFQRDKSALHGARSSAWGFLYDSKLPQTRSWPPLVKNAGGHEVEHLPACNAQQYSTGWTALNSEVERILPLKGGTAGVLNQISSVVSSASNLEKGLDLPVALSLLSANPWPSSDPEEILTFPLQISDATSTLTQPCTHARNSQQYYCQNNGSSQYVPQQTTMLSFHMQNFNSSSRLQVYQLHKAAGLLHSRQMHPCW